MDTEQIKQMATDVNNVAAESFASGVRHTRRVLLPKIGQFQAKNKQLKDALEKYGVHQEGCNWCKPGICICSCGFYEALQETSNE